MRHMAQACVMLGDQAVPTAWVVSWCCLLRLAQQGVIDRMWRLQIHSHPCILNPATLPAQAWQTVQATAYLFSDV